MTDETTDSGAGEREYREQAEATIADLRALVSHYEARIAAQMEPEVSENDLRTFIFEVVRRNESVPIRLLNYYRITPRVIPPAVPATPAADDASERVGSRLRCTACGEWGHLNAPCPASADASGPLSDFRALGATIHRFRCTNPDCRHYEDEGYFTPRDNDAASAVMRSDWLAARESAAATRARAEGAAEALRPIQNLAMEHANCSGCPTPWWLTQELAKEAGRVDL